MSIGIPILIQCRAEIVRCPGNPGVVSENGSIVSERKVLGLRCNFSSAVTISVLPSGR